MKIIFISLFSYRKFSKYFFIFNNKFLKNQSKHYQNYYYFLIRKLMFNIQKLFIKINFFEPENFE